MHLGLAVSVVDELEAHPNLEHRHQRHGDRNDVERRCQSVRFRDKRLLELRFVVVGILEVVIAQVSVQRRKGGDLKATKASKTVSYMEDADYRQTIATTLKRELGRRRISAMIYYLATLFCMFVAMVVYSNYLTQQKRARDADVKAKRAARAAYRSATGDMEGAENDDLIGLAINDDDVW
jgi:hypothetical protein